MRQAITVSILTAAITVGAVLAAVIPAQGQTRAARSGESPPECVHWRVLDNGGAGPLVRVLVCGTGSNGESPARDDTNWATVVVDGDAFHTDGCGSSWANPCVILWPASPQGVKATT
jgi:hypothetical protein